MANDESTSLLAEDEPAAARVERPEGASAVFLTCEHAGRRIPVRLGDLGVPASELERHIAWDIGAEAVASRLSAHLDATLVLQTYSRLVIDCNRQPSRHDSMPVISELTEIPGNRNLHPDHAAARVGEIFRPYHDTIEEALDRRRDEDRETLLLAVHSFTPVYKGEARPWHIGLLYNHDDRVARVLREVVGEERGLCVGDNEPYAVSDEGDYTIPVHGEQRGIHHIEIEVRQDLIEDEAGQREWSERLADWMDKTVMRLANTPGF